MTSTRDKPQDHRNPDVMGLVEFHLFPQDQNHWTVFSSVISSTDSQLPMVATEQDVLVKLELGDSEPITYW